MKFTLINGTLVQVPRQTIQINMAEVTPAPLSIKEVVGLTPEELEVYNQFKHLLFITVIAGIFVVSTSIGLPYPMPLVPVHAFLQF